MKQTIKTYLFILLASAIMLPSCKKDHDCQCVNSNGGYDAGTIKNTKMQAKKQCEGLSVGDTKCELK